MVEYHFNAVSHFWGSLQLQEPRLELNGRALAQRPVQVLFVYPARVISE